MNYSISQIKSDAKELLRDNYFPCIIASFLSGILISMVFSYALDGTTNVQNAFDTTALYTSMMNVTTYEEISNYFTNYIQSIVNEIGYDTYYIMLKRYIIALLLTNILQLIYRFLVVLPLKVGNCTFYFNAYKENFSYKNLILPFKQNYYNTVKIMFFMQLKIFLWSLLFVIPGIIKAYEYFMVPYLLAEDPDIESSKVFRLSSEMMYQNKLTAFVLQLSFIGWLLLSALTGGLAFVFYVSPYMDAANTRFALKIKHQKEY